ncbi:MAG: ATP-dependent DNA helicase RecG [Ignavibacteria bacterium]|jgi:ATP-dependent DNA helicase RecG
MSKTLNDPVQYIKSVGPKRAESFAEIGINVVNDLLFYFPSKYLDRSTIVNTLNLVKYVSNGYDGEVTIIGEVVDNEHIRYGKKQMLKVSFKDKTGRFECVWFQGIRFFKDRFKAGQTYALSGKPVITRYGHIQIAHPDFDRLSDKESDDFFNTGKIIPFYRVHKELKNQNIGDFSLRKIINNVVTTYYKLLSETLPAYLLNKYNYPDISTSVLNMHYPSNKDVFANSQNRFKYEELFYFELLIALRRNKIKKIENGIAFNVNNNFIEKFLSSLPFQLTNAQLKVIDDLKKDMYDSSPMNRLIQGDVGSGKTIVCLVAMLVAINNGYQAALMVPTEILANQHFLTIGKFLSRLNIKISLLIGSSKSKKKKELIDSIKNNEVDLIIGTHALIQDNIEFNKLGLVVIDEQHRFGVSQRLKLINKSITPDTIVTTATPIPRTLSMTVYGDLDVSIIDELPKNRKPIKTYLRNDESLPKIYKYIVDESKKGNQSFIIYPLVEDSEKLNLKSAETYYNDLKESYFKNINVGMVHGKMKWEEKDKIMLDFANQKYDVLISTTVIEVGIDIPNANIILINDANRFGLSQLHQLRGRVGRGKKQAYCILVSDLSNNKSIKNIKESFQYLSSQEIEKNKAIIRLNSMAEHTSGFELSEIDLKLRGPGDIFGTKQIGFPEFKHADLVNDYEILLNAKTDAFNIIKDDPLLSKQINSIIRDKVLKEYKHKLIYLNTP